MRIYGPELPLLREKPEEVILALEGIDGIADLKKELVTEIPQVEVKVDLAKAQRYGLKPGDVRRAAAVVMAGEEVGDFFVDGKAYDVQVWSTPATRSSLTNIRELLINTPDGGHVRLGDVADIGIYPTANVILREGQTRKIDVTANVKGRDLGSVARDVEDTIKKVGLPAGLSRRGAGRVCGAAGSPAESVDCRRAWP